MRLSSVTRVLLGLGFVVFATNYFIPFLPAQDPPPPEALLIVSERDAVRPRHPPVCSS